MAFPARWVLDLQHCRFHLVTITMIHIAARVASNVSVTGSKCCLNSGCYPSF
jgi:hypothetical protein